MNRLSWIFNLMLLYCNCIANIILLLYYKEHRWKEIRRKWSCAIVGTYLTRRKTFEKILVTKKRTLPPKMFQSIQQYRLLPVLLRGMRGRTINDYQCVISIPAKDRLSRDAFMGSRIVWLRWEQKDEFSSSLTGKGFWKWGRKFKK